MLGIRPSSSSTESYTTATSKAEEPDERSERRLPYTSYSSTVKLTASPTTNSVLVNCARQPGTYTSAGVTLKGRYGSEPSSGTTKAPALSIASSEAPSAMYT